MSHWVAGHPEDLCRGALLLDVMYSASGDHSSGWKSGLRKWAVLKCELDCVSTSVNLGELRERRDSLPENGRLERDMRRGLDKIRLEFPV